MNAGVRRCAACQRELPTEVYLHIYRGEVASYYSRCLDCRRGFTDSQLAEAQRLYESGAPGEAVAAAIGKRDDSIYHYAGQYGWNRAARRAAMRAAPPARDPSKCRGRHCPEPPLPGRERCAKHEKYHRWYLSRTNVPKPRSPRTLSNAGAGDADAGLVEIRCHACLAHRVTPLAAPEPCHRCGTSGATPATPLDEVLEVAA